MAHDARRLRLALAGALLASPVAAQTDTQPAPPSDVSRSGGSLSEKLGDTGGVIHPQGSVDPAMQKLPSESGRMPVVPPPGTPGGRTDVVPK